MISGRTPAAEKPTKRAKGVKPSLSAFSLSMTTTAAAPSLKGLELPAVTDPVWFEDRL